ncbi:hypothetical protein SERLA73DRAFT_79722 [Serpula lacrymans var. lacrymans S7.3]|uniref:BTB domain-containing protein n=2 Tax=Serpula lacrymans var. lacrymans TaxID=341189 RepID=F8QHC6_SERL3|nr:uncharacterized protein SERLADRAFT_442387 [Serpula lacrymans var. lacrymans S7.9]EGN92309.1 hypothetical protein SERLA73DRAFT_79722 [Serpula lacrymans var. lacrymans S7.3]EGO20250.1 hypothetical protein SERLADRAFT_442387 [Serpula lacrymans var. lacrymans S7.9]
MSAKKARIDNLLRISLLGEPLTNTQFHLFTTCSVSSHKANRPRVLFASDALLVESSDYFTKLLVEKEAVDAVIEFSGHCPYSGGLLLDEYGYASDSDLEDEEDVDSQPPVVSEPSKIEFQENKRSKQGEGPKTNSLLSPPEEVDMCEWLFEEDSSLQLTGNVEDNQREYTSSINTTPPSTVVPTASASDVSPPRLIQCRHLFVKDTAFRTWKTLLFYLYTDQISWSALKSQTGSKETRDTTVEDSDGPPPCSPKSMYRLATKIASEPLKKLAFDAISSRLSESNILEELSSDFTSKFPEVLKLQTDKLYEHIASRPVVNGLPEVAKRIAQGKLPHGAEIIVALYRRVPTEHYPMKCIVASEEKTDEMDVSILATRINGLPFGERTEVREIDIGMPPEVPGVCVTTDVECRAIIGIEEIPMGARRTERRRKKWVTGHITRM